MHRCVRQVKLSKPVDVTEPEGGADSYHCVCYSVRILFLRVASTGFLLRHSTVLDMDMDMDNLFFPLFLVLWVSIRMVVGL
jgi:hypothetical protein